MLSRVEHEKKNITSRPGLHCLPFHVHFLNAFLYCKTKRLHIGLRRLRFFFNVPVLLKTFYGYGYAYLSARTFFSDIPITFVSRKNEVVIPLYSRPGYGVVYR